LDEYQLLKSPSFWKNIVKIQHRPSVSNKLSISFVDIAVISRDYQLHRHLMLYLQDLEDGFFLLCNFCGLRQAVHAPVSSKQLSHCIAIRLTFMKAARNNFQ